MNKEVIFKKIIEALQLLTTVNVEKVNFQNCCQQALIEICWAGIFKCQFNLNEQREIATLIKNNINKIDTCTFALGYSFDPNYVPTLLKYRSALQFILDDFKNFPLENEKKLNDSLTILKESESIETLDEALENWKNYPSSGIDEISHNFDILKRPEGIPESHKWWL